MDTSQRAARGTTVVGVILTLAAVAGGCRGRAQSTSGPVPDTRVGVVDLQTVTRAHPRWPELDGVVTQLNAVQAQLAQLPSAAVLADVDAQRALAEESRQLQGELDKEIAFLKEDGERRLRVFADDLRSEQEAQLQQTRQALQTQAEQEVLAKRDELRAQLRAAEQQIRDEYRYPLLNLRLRAEVAGLTSEEETKQLERQMQALAEERDKRIAEKADEMRAAFDEFQKAKENEINAQLKTAQETLQAEGQRRLATRQQELQAEVKQAAAQAEQTLRARWEHRRQELLAAAQRGPLGRPGTSSGSLSDRSRQLHAELTSLEARRLRMEDSILAEVKIEVATIAQERKLDVVLTRYITNVAGIDITSEVVQKLKR